MSLACPSCSTALTIEYGSISCKPCNMTGDTSFWAGLIVQARRGERINPCVFCQGSTRQSEIGYRECLQCGIEYHPQIEHRIAGMSAKARAQFIGYYHAMNEHSYRWCYEPVDRDAEREYARGWLSAPIKTDKALANRRLWGKEASRDASMWR